jgi:ubiquitin carboxyl-terminal hydrolase 7
MIVKKLIYTGIDEEIAKKDMPPIEEETIEFKCVHWNVTDWNKLDHRVLGPVFQAGGHDW